MTKTSATVSKLLGEEAPLERSPRVPQHSEMRDHDDVSDAISAIEAAIQAKKPMTIVFGPESLEKIRYLIEKPHHGKSVQAVRTMLINAVVS